MPDERCRVLRRRLARREQLVHARSRAKNEIHAVLQRRLQGKPPCSDLFGVKGRAWLAELGVAAGGARVRRRRDPSGRVPRRRGRRGRAADRPTGPVVAGDPAADDRPGREPDLRRVVHRRGRRPEPVHDQPQARRLPRPGPEGPPVRRGAGAQRPDQQARIGVGALGAGRGGVERGRCNPGRCTRSTSAPAPGAGTARRSSRPPASSRSCSGACSPAGGLRPPATVADQEEAAPPGDHRRRPEIHREPPREPGAPTTLSATPNASSPTGRDLLQADGPRPASRRAGEKSGRERDTGARIN